MTLYEFFWLKYKNYNQQTWLRWMVGVLSCLNKKFLVNLMPGNKKKSCWDASPLEIHAKHMTSIQMLDISWKKKQKKKIENFNLEVKFIYLINTIYTKNNSPIIYKKIVVEHVIILFNYMKFPRKIHHDFITEINWLHLILRCHSRILFRQTHMWR